MDSKAKLGALRQEFTSLTASKVVKETWRLTRNSTLHGNRSRWLLFGPCLLALAGGTSNRVAAQGSPGGMASSQSTSQASGWPRIYAVRNEGPIKLADAVQPSADASSHPSQTPSYLRDVLPVLMGKCSRCHNEQARFVYNWLDYRTAFADRWEIARRVWDSYNGAYFKESMPISNSPESLAITDDERLTIRNWVYAGAPRGVAPPEGAPKTKAEKTELGRRLFSSICAACHQPTGKGVPNVFPPLAGSDFLNADKNRAIKTVINGRQGEIVVNGLRFNNSMPKFPLSDQDIASVLTFVYNSFGNSGIEVSGAEVALLRNQPPDVQGPSAPQPKSPFE
jgi:mono/diheme cytochrome c family protein